jgi:3-deoxy-D-manno-octulosonic-acid transferase
MAFFIKYEFWFNYLHILKHRQVPVYSVSSIFRPEQVFFRWYGRQYGRVLKCFTRFFVQNEQSRELLKTLGITDVEVVGDTRFDRVLQIKEQAKQLPISLTPAPSPKGEGNMMSEAPKVFIAGSSWPPDEEIFIRYFNEHREWTLIVAPHVIGEDHLQQIEEKLEGWHVTRYTTLASSSAPWSCAPGKALIIDCFGLLSSIYRYGQVAYVGGGFGVGIHNVVEAAVWGMPVFFGPNNERFREAQELKQNGGGIEINSYDDFARCMDELAANSEMLAGRGRTAGDYVTSRAGATEKIFKYLQL